jgi:hypothetical protein
MINYRRMPMAPADQAAARRTSKFRFKAALLSVAAAALVSAALELHRRSRTADSSPAESVEAEAPDKGAEPEPSAARIPSAEPPPAEAPDEPGAGRPTADDWNGSALYGPDRTSNVVIRDVESWIKFWPMVSAEPVPLLDFESQMVVGIVIGGSPASVRITGIQSGPRELVVRYARRPSGGAAAAPSYQYHLKAVAKSALPIRFEEAR